MDMDIDIDELELLEANSRFHEDQLDPTSPDPYPYPPEDEPHHSSPQINGQKRSRSDDSEPPNLENAAPSDEKRNKISQDVEPEAIKDCLRFSPPRKESVREEVEEVVVAEQQEKYLSIYASRIDGDFIPVTAPSGGDRVYAKISRVEKDVRSKKLDVKTHSNSLTCEPINVLLQRVEQEAFNKALEESTGFQSDAVLPETQLVHEQLWVDKYSPNSFTELLSDESTNREVLLWFKQWDSCVFGSEIRNTSEEVLSALKRHSFSSQHPKPSDSISLGKRGGHNWSNRNFRTSNTFDRENITMKGVQDSWNKKSRPMGPPEQKILLLCGPPGLGKTTLSHVAAKHCGYHVVEVNASDDRSSSSIEAKILDVVQMNSVMADSKPKCLVIDEIDGALGDGKGAAEVILKMVSAEKKSANEKENTDHGDQSGRMTSKKRRKPASLSRPIICICNDLYAPALRQLRQVAKVHVFVQPTVSRVVNRLKYICGKEGMKTSSIALTALAEYTECDVRSCLNTLQFLNKKKEDLNVLNISSQVIGRKDISRSVFDIWKEIFQKRKVKQERKYDSKCDGMSTGSDSLPSLVSNRGDYDVILDGIHENILQLHYHDPMMHKTVKCINSLGISDLFHQYIMRTQQMPLLAYQPTVVITIHGLVAQIQRPTIEWPKSHQRCRANMTEKMEMFQSWRNTISPCISRHLSIKSFVEDSVSPLLHIFSPPALRPVAMHLLSEKDKCVLTQLVSKMVSCSVSYKNKKPTPTFFNQEHEVALDSSSLFFDPVISDFIIFKGYTSGHYVLPLAVKQVLVHEAWHLRILWMEEFLPLLNYNEELDLYFNVNPIFQIEKEKILQASKSAHSKDGCSKESVALVSAKNSEAHRTNVDQAAVSSVNNESGRNISNPIQHIPTAPTASSKFNSTRTTVPNVELKSSGSPKKHSTGSIDFYARFRKVANTGSQHTDSAIQRKTTSERDSRPVLFKYNEGFTNAVKRPVRMRDFLL